MSDTYPFAKDKFPTWSMQANAMLQLAMWSALKEKDVYKRQPVYMIQFGSSGNGAIKAPGFMITSKITDVMSPVR